MLHAELLNCLMKCNFDILNCNLNKLSLLFLTPN